MPSASLSCADVSDQVGYTLFTNRFLRRKLCSVSGAHTQVSVAWDGVTHTVDYYKSIYSQTHHTTETVWSRECPLTPAAAPPPSSTAGASAR
ncbi:MAG: hypothetical protein JXX28_06150 [Deltaproteobacteria bacterium]|nr:hypothetical protein [Deltaproteobacteria bacterium]